MMKKLIMVLVACLIVTPLLAAESNIAHLKIKMTLPSNETKHYLCLYDVGCLNFSAMNNKKSYPIALGVMSNLNKVVISDASKKHLSFQALPASCEVMLKPDQEIIVQGELVNNSQGSQISNLRCHVAAIAEHDETLRA